MQYQDEIFQIVSLIVLFGWIPILAFPKWDKSLFVTRSVVAVVLALFYSYGVVHIFNDPSDFMKFSTLDGVYDLFMNKTAVLVGWIHYLAFDLLVGSVILEIGQKKNIRHGFLVSCMVASFMLGPVGWLLFQVILRLQGMKKQS